MYTKYSLPCLSVLFLLLQFEHTHIFTNPLPSSSKITPSHNFALNVLFFAYLAAQSKLHPIIISTPAKTCAPTYRPPILWMSCPAIGGPVKTAKETSVKTMPIRVPAMRRSVVRLERVAGKRDWIAAPTMP